MVKKKVSIKRLKAYKKRILDDTTDDENANISISPKKVLGQLKF